MRLWLVSELASLLVIANATPVIISLLLGRRGDRALDGGHLFRDGRPWLGPSKTLRGLFGSIAACTLLAPVFDLRPLQGALFATLAMLGDATSSFSKRRLGLASGHSVPLLDQLPETLLPLWVMQPVLGAGAMEMILAIAVFSAIDLLFTALLRSYRARSS